MFAACCDFSDYSIKGGSLCFSLRDECWDGWCCFFSLAFFENDSSIISRLEGFLTTTSDILFSSLFFSPVLSFIAVYYLCILSLIFDSSSVFI